MTDAPEATDHNAPQAPAAPVAHDAPATTPRERDAETARPAQSADLPGHASPAGDEANAGPGDVPRARRSRGGRGRRRSGQAVQAAGSSGTDSEGIEGHGDAGDEAGPDAPRADSNDAAANIPGASGTPDDRRAPRPRQQQARQQHPQKQPQKQPQHKPPQQNQPPRKVHPVLERLFELYPKMFGARFLPLKLGVYQDLLERHGDEFKAEDLKLALGLHARSTRYLDAVAAGHQRHDLEGEPVEPVAPEHVHHAILEVFRRRQSRSPEDLSGRLRERIVAAIEASGIGREAYAERVRARDANGNAALDDALAELGRQGAKREALLRAFEATGKTEAEFADMYGMETREVTRTLQRARKDKADERAFAAAAATAAAATAASAVALAAPVAGDDTTDDAVLETGAGAAAEEVEVEKVAAPAAALEATPVEAASIVQPATSKPEV